MFKAVLSKSKLKILKQGKVHLGKADGMGVFIVEDKYQYNIEWKNGKLNGFGILNYYNGDVYEGMV